MSIPATVISLARRPERREQFLAWNQSQDKLAFTFFDALDGSTLDRAQLEAEGLLVPGAEFSPGALGCALSHRALWLQAARREVPTLIFEDDACLQHHFAPVLKHTVPALPQGWDFLLLGYNTDAVITLGLPNALGASIVFHEGAKQHPDYFQHLREDPSFSSRPLCLPVFQAWGTLAYVVSPAGARHLLDACFPLASVELPMDLQEKSIPTFSLDGMMNVGLRDGRLKGYAFFPPIVLGPNALADSDVAVAPEG